MPKELFSESEQKEAIESASEESLVSPELKAEAERIREQIGASIEPIEAELEHGMTERDVKRDTLIQHAGVEDIRALKTLEEKTESITAKHSKLRRMMKVGLMTALPLALAAHHRREEPPPEVTSFAKHEEAAKQLHTTGITDERKFAYTKGVSETLYKLITPVNYEGNPLAEAERIGWIAPIMSLTDNRSRIAETMPEREDAWRMYLGLPQQHNTFGVSDFKPDHSTQDKYYYRINDWLHKTYRGKNLDGTTQSDAQFIQHLVEITKTEQLKKGETKGAWAIGGINVTRHADTSVIVLRDTFKADKAKTTDQDAPALGIMGQYKLSSGKDETGAYLSYYDKWNLEGSLLEGESGVMGKAYEIYDRIYFDPNTYQPLEKK